MYSFEAQGPGWKIRKDGQWVGQFSGIDRAEMVRIIGAMNQSPPPPAYYDSWCIMDQNGQFLADDGNMNPVFLSTPDQFAEYDDRETAETDLRDDLIVFSGTLRVVRVRFHLNGIGDKTDYQILETL